MAVLPDRLDGEAADGLETNELKTLRCEIRWRTFVKMAEHVGLALATGAWTIAAQFLELQVGLVAVVPQNR